MEKGVTIVRTGTGRRLEIPTAWLIGRAAALEAHGTPIKAAWGQAIECWLEQESLQAQAEDEARHQEAWHLAHEHDEEPEREATDEREIFGHPRLEEDES